MLRRSFTLFCCKLSGGLLLLCSAGCVDPYMPEVLDASANYLVVDGFINGNGRTRITLSRTTNTTTTSAPPPETGARLTLVDDAGTRYNLTETSAGRYRSDSLLLSPARQYQLRLSTSAGTAYASDLVPLKVTPAINQFRWRLVNNQVQLLLSTRDPARASHYYRWGLAETWEFHSAFESELEYRNGQLGYRITPIYTCWRTERPSAIKQASTDQLSQDAISDLQLLNLNSRTERFKIRYSVLVSQYTETPAEFAYYELLRKNTEAVGGVNDPLPTQLTGNVHRLDNPAEPVLGFVSAHTVQQQRLFISRQDLPLLNNSAYDTPYRDCTLTKAVAGIDFSRPDIVVIRQDTAGLLISSPACADCRLRGTNVKPGFW
jgi:hypothetical protein